MNNPDPSQDRAALLLAAELMWDLEGTFCKIGIRSFKEFDDYLSNYYYYYFLVGLEF